MTRVRALTALAVAAAITLPLSLDAHRMWMVPSATVLSGTDPWVTVDAAISNDLFYFEHHPMRLDNLAVLGPTGAPVDVEHASTGRYRSTFDVHLTVPGTYKIAIVSQTAMASWTEAGETRRWRGPVHQVEANVPAAAADRAVTQQHSRMEVFVTSGTPTTTVLATTGVGLELAPVTHPNDWVTGEAATFRLLLNGAPASNVEVVLIPGGIRYRDRLNDQKTTTDTDGRFSFTVQDPGMYWLNASVQDAPTAVGLTASLVPVLPAQGPGPGRGGNRASYTATFEVLPQ